MISFYPMPSVPVGENPMVQDKYHMPIGLGNNCIIMTEGRQRLDYFIVHNTETGERTRVMLDGSKLQTYFVIYKIESEGDDFQVFTCEADNFDHAIEQCRDAYPGCVICVAHTGRSIPVKGE